MSNPDRCRSTAAVTSLDQQCLLHGHFFVKALDRVISAQLFELGRRVLIQKLINGEVTAANPNVYFVLLAADSDASLPELVDAF